MSETPQIRVELIYATAQSQPLLQFALPAGASVADAINHARTLGLPELPLEGNVGIFARACSLNELLRDGDRVEIYRPLIADPKSQRRERARQSDWAGYGGSSGKRSG